MIAATLDPDGRRVVLTGERWLHIKGRHPRLARELDAIMRTIRDPDVQMAGRSDRELWFFTRWSGTLPWLHVVVHFEGGEGWIVTAFPRSSLPPR